MNVFRDGVIAFFSAVGMTTVVWLLAGAVLHAGRPTIPGLLLVLPVRGEALALEHDVRELRREQSAGGTDRHCRLRSDGGGPGPCRLSGGAGGQRRRGGRGGLPAGRRRQEIKMPVRDLSREGLHRHVKERKSWKN